MRVESGSGLTPDLSRLASGCTCPQLGEKEHAAFDITVTSLLIPSILTATSLSEGSAARVCNRLSGYSGYSDIRKNLSVRIAI